MEEAAAALSVDPSTYWRWEAGRKAHRHLDRERIAGFVSAAPDAATVATTNVAQPPAYFDLSVALLERRCELRLTQKQAAAQIGARTSGRS